MGREREREDSYVTVPSFFRCPISLDVMRSPVSLSTGVTYDRASIQRWLDGGNNTCPATMQTLQTKDLVPNHTLHRLIQIWSDSVSRRTTTGDAAAAAPEPSPSSLSEDQLLPLIDHVSRMPNSCSQSLSRIASSAAESESKVRFLAGNHKFVPALVNILCNGVSGNAEFVSEVVRVLDFVAKEYSNKEELMRLLLRGNRDCLSSMLLVLKRGSSESRTGCVRILESIAIDADSKLQIAEKEELLPELLLQIRAETESSDPALTEAIISCLIEISAPKRIKTLIVRLGAVKSVTKLLLDANQSTSVAEKALKMLETLSSCRDGRFEICSEPECVPAILGKVLKVSSAATEHAVTILWSVCYLFRDQRAEEAVEKNNGLTKILLLMQSNCSPDVRQMSGDLLKIFRVGSKSCISSYDTKTTHIMPF